MEENREDWMGEEFECYDSAQMYYDQQEQDFDRIRLESFALVWDDIIGNILSKETFYEKYEYIKSVLERSTFAENIECYKNISRSDDHLMPFFWEGVVSARAGTEKHILYPGKYKEAFDLGASQYRNVYVPLREMLFLLSKGEPIDHLLKSTSKTTFSQSEVLYKRLYDNDFFSLSKVSDLSSESQTKLVVLLSENQLPYQIAFLKLVGFIDFLLQRSRTYGVGYSNLSVILTIEQPIHPRKIKGECLVLNPRSSESRSRYTAHRHLEIVEKKYEELKRAYASLSALR